MSSWESAESDLSRRGTGVGFCLAASLPLGPASPTVASRSPPAIAGLASAGINAWGSSSSSSSSLPFSAGSESPSVEKAGGGPPHCDADMLGV